MSVSLPPAACALVDAQVGTFLGDSRSAVLRFAITTWLTENYAAIAAVYEQKR